MDFLTYIGKVNENPVRLEEQDDTARVRVTLMGRDATVSVLHAPAAEAMQLEVGEKVQVISWSQGEGTVYALSDTATNSAIPKGMDNNLPSKVADGVELIHAIYSTLVDRGVDPQDARALASTVFINSR